eukprot:TRINITY_DN62247_c0_g1_i1.p1 TRINITY_DN62247_c0_g1~~TRINITY_DN62247_c0_g1_i1.p1  ORF type:complete len:284 (+),score=82.80 TRINITY_DN62247_c0_g1_i1:84-854(+)
MAHGRQAGWDGSGAMREEASAGLGPRQDTTRRGSVHLAAGRGVGEDMSEDLADVQEDRGKFYVVVNGTVESAIAQGTELLYCKYRFERGRDWDVLKLSNDTESLHEGVTQVAERSVGPTPLFSWNMPFSVAFASTNPYGWPKLVLSVYNVGRNDEPHPPCGYGWCHVPTKPGRYEVDVPLFRPVAASPQASLLAWLRGFQGFSFGFSEMPEFRSGAVWASGEHREVTRVEAAGGVVRVVFHVLTKNMTLHGFSQGS